MWTAMLMQCVLTLGPDPRHFTTRCGEHWTSLLCDYASNLSHTWHQEPNPTNLRYSGQTVRGRESVLAERKVPPGLLRLLCAFTLQLIMWKAWVGSCWELAKPAIRSLNSSSFYFRQSETTWQPSAAHATSINHTDAAESHFLDILSPTNACIIYTAPRRIGTYNALANEWLTSTHSEAHLFSMLQEASHRHNKTVHASAGSTKNFPPALKYELK